MKRPGLIPVLLGLLLFGCGPAPSDPAGVAKPKPARKAHRVEVVRLAPETVQPRLTRPATLKPQREVRIFNQEEGLLTRLLPYEGDAVEQGAELARFDDRLLRAELTKADATLNQARQDLKRLQGLVKRKMVSDEAIERARTAVAVASAEASLLRTRLDYTIIRAPFAGVVSARLVEPGDVLARFSHLLTLIQAAPLIAEVSVSELWLPRLRVGDSVTLGIDALPGRTFTAIIGRIHPTVDRSSRQGIVELVLDPVPRGARPGQFSRATFQAPSHQALLLPFASLQYDSDGEYVMVVGDDGKAHRTAVVTGDGYDDRLELRSGLEAGAQVVVRGLLGLDDGSTVSIDSPGGGGSVAP